MKRADICDSNLYVLKRVYVLKLNTDIECPKIGHVHKNVNNNNNKSVDSSLLNKKTT